MSSEVAADASGKVYPGKRAVFSWMLFDWAAQPYFSLITTFVFAPYFATRVASDAATGQSMWGFATAAAGLTIALMSPVLGAIADASGRRKPWIAGFGLMLIFGASMMWIGVPGNPDIILPLLLAYIIATIGVEFATVFNNAMMPQLVPPDRIGRLSGSGWALGYVGGICSLVLVLGFMAASPTTGKTLFGLAPLLGLDPAMYEGDRASGPFTAIWFAIFTIPMFLFAPDLPARMKIGPAVRQGLTNLRDTLRSLRHQRSLPTFLIANMVYTDGLVSLFAFGGIYAAGTFGWNTIQIGTFGILLAMSGAVGAWLGGKLDDRFGSKCVIIGAISLLIFSIAAILMTDRQTILLISVTPPVEGGGLFASPAEKAYLLLGALIGMAGGPLQAASRSLLIHLAPRDEIGAYFGLFALTGKVTAFLGPLLIGIVTAVTASQKAGMAVLLLFFGAGLILLMRVRAD